MSFRYLDIIKQALKEEFFDASPGQWSQLLQIKVDRVETEGPHWRAICGYHVPDSGVIPMSICQQSMKKVFQSLLTLQVK